jgi:hypothetical protein
VTIDETKEYEGAFFWQFNQMFPGAISRKSIADAKLTKCPSRNFDPAIASRPELCLAKIKLQN